MLVSKLLFDLSQEADWNLQFTFLNIFSKTFWIEGEQKIELLKLEVNCPTLTYH